MPSLFTVKDPLNERDTEWIVENELRGFKVDAVFPSVRLVLGMIPLDLHTYLQYRKYAYVKSSADVAASQDAVIPFTADFVITTSHLANVPAHPCFILESGTMPPLRKLEPARNLGGRGAREPRGSACLLAAQTQITKRTQRRGAGWYPARRL